MPTLPMRPLQRAAGLIIFASLMSGCFQTAGAALQATMTPQGGAAITIASPTIEVPPPTAITPVAQLPTTSDTLAPTVPPLVFTTPTGIAPLLTDTLAVADTLIPTQPNTPTNLPPPTATFTPSITPTEPPLITPTQNLPGTKIALQATFDSQSATQTQQAIYDQATAIVDTATAGAAAAFTQIATLQGTGIPPNGVPPTAAPGQPTPVPNGTTGVTIVETFTPTPLPGINSSPQNGAMGNITNDCLYTVVDGDRLYRIALRFNLTPYQLAYANRLINPDLVVPGEVLRIPGCTTSAASGTPVIGVTPGATAVPGASASVSTSSGQTYMVVDGDTLYSIANRFGVRVIALAQANGITNLNLIYIGQNLTIP